MAGRARTTRNRASEGRGRGRPRGRRRVTSQLRARAAEIGERLKREYPSAVCALEYGNPYELLVATILSAQCTDDRVNLVTRSFFGQYPTPSDLARADPAQVEELIRTTGFFRSKTKNLIAMAEAVEERFGGEVPRGLEDLTSLPGVGRKTANVVRSVGFGEPGLPVDTHVTRLSRRLRLTRQSDPVKIEFDLMPLFDPEEWGDLSLRLIDHGRRVCFARRPNCAGCVLNDVCPSAEA